jgi:hypothetical protein
VQRVSPLDKLTPISSVHQMYEMSSSMPIA